MEILNCIYKIYSKSKPEKFYIGSTTNFNKRKDRHKTSLKHNWHHNIILQNHYNKYGKEDLIFEVLESDIEINNILNREQFYIDTLKPIFNILKIAGSNLGYKASEETKRKISESLKKRVLPKEIIDEHHKRMIGNTYRLGLKHSPETIELMSANLKGNQHAKGAIRTEEFKKNLSIKNKGRQFTEEARVKNLLVIRKPIKQFTKEGVFIREWTCAYEAELELNIKHIGSCCNGKRKTAGKFKWEYV